MKIRVAPTVMLLACAPTTGAFAQESHEAAVFTAAQARLATSLGARPGRLLDVIECPDRPPTVDEFKGGYWGCRLLGNTELVVQVADPVPTDDGFSVWVGLWREAKDAEGRPRQVVSSGREVLLARSPDGAWSIIGFGQRSAGHY